MSTTNTLVARRYGSTFTCTITTTRASQTSPPRTKHQKIQTEPSYFHGPIVTPPPTLTPNGYKLALVHFHPQSFTFPDIQNMFIQNYNAIFAQHTQCFQQNTRCTRSCPYLGTLPSSAFLAPLQLRGAIETSGTLLQPYQLPTCSFDYSL